MTEVKIESLKGGAPSLAEAEFGWCRAYDKAPSPELLQAFNRLLAESYLKSRELGLVHFGEEGKPCGRFFQKQGGRCCAGILLSNGDLSTDRLHLGPLGGDSDLRLHYIQYSERLKSFWLKFSEAGLNGIRDVSCVCLSEIDGSVRIICDEASKRDSDYYDLSFKHGRIAFDLPISCAHTISDWGVLQASTVLPDLSTLGRVTRINLPEKIRDPRLHSIEYSSEERGFWRELSALDKYGERKSVFVLFAEDPSVQGPILWSFTPGQKALWDLYRLAGKSDGPIEGEFPIPGMVTPQGHAARSFITPSGVSLGVQIRIGLPVRGCENPRAVRIFQDQSEFHLTLEADGPRGKTRRSTLVLAHDQLLGVDNPRRRRAAEKRSTGNSH